MFVTVYDTYFNVKPFSISPELGFVELALEIEVD